MNPPSKHLAVPQHFIITAVLTFVAIATGCSTSTSQPPADFVASVESEVAPDLSIPTSTSRNEEPVHYAKGKLVAKIECRSLRESSGLAPSRISPDILWTHNDSGDRPQLFAVDTAGRLIATCPVKGASAIDWEDIASLTINEKNYLLVADCGDNQAIRKMVQLHLIEESLPSTEEATPGKKKERKEITHELKSTKTIRVQFPDGPNDCESLAFDPTTKEILLISKSWKPFCRAYSLPFPDEDSNEVCTAKPIAIVELAGVTGMDISPDGRQAVVLTYANAYLYTRDPEESWATAFSKVPRMISMPTRKQGEAICFGHDGQSLFLTDEQTPCPLFHVKPAG